jgi:hypothetical protein
MIGFGLNIGNRVMGGGVDAQAQAHYNRVIADGGVVPAGLNGVNAFFNAVKTIYGTSDITTAVSVGLDAHYLGYKLGAGSGTTLGQAAQKLYSCAGSSGDVVQTTAASQPLLLAHNGASTDNYWYGSGVAGNDVSTGVIAPVATLELDVKVQLNGGNALQARTIIAQDSGSAGNRIFSLEFVNATTGTLGFFYNSGFVSYQVSSAGIGIINNYSGWVRATYLSNGTTATIIFYSSTNGTTWNILSTHSGLISTGLGTSNSSLRVGSNNGGNLYQGGILYASISNVIDGTPTRIFNPATYNASTSQTQWTSTTGEVWTINTGTAGTGYKGALVDRTIVMSDGVDDRISITGLTTMPLVSIYQSKTYYSASIGSKVGFLISTLSGGSGEFGSAPSATRWYSDNAYFIAQFSPSTLRSLYYAKYKTNAQDFKINNGASPTITNATFSGANCLFLFSDNTTVFMNVQYQTFVMSKIEDNPAQVTAMYNYIRTINNNAF